jgi:aminoglycoside phosphotransferase (APT) family kinase protein
MDLDVTTALSGQTGLAGVQWLLLGAPAREALRGALSDMLNEGAMLGAIALQRAKYKPGRHLTAYYAVEAREPASGPLSDRNIEVIWKPAGAADPHGDPAAWQAMQAEARELGVSAPFQRLAAAIPDWNMYIRVSPLDPDFPQLARVSEPGYVRSMLASGGQAQSGAPGSEYEIATIRYRPGQRHVLRYDPANAAEASIEGVVFAKIYNSDKGARTFDVVTRVADWLTASSAGLTTVRPLRYVPADGAVLYPCVSGTALSSLLQDPAVDSAHYLGLAGSALRALHQMPTDLIELRPHSFAKEIKGIVSASEHIHALLPETAAQIQSILADAQALHERLAPEPPAFAYGDFKADHLWATPTGLILIDFDTAYLFDPAIDLGKFLADLHWWYDRYNLPGVEQAREHFLAGYGAAALPERVARARLYEVLVLVKSTVRRVRLFDADWEQRTSRLIHTAAGLLRKLQEDTLT